MEATPQELIAIVRQHRARRGHGSRHTANRARYADRLRVRIAELERRLQHIEGGNGR